MFISSKSVAALSVAASLVSSTSAFAPKSSTTSTSTKVGAATLADAFGGITNPFAPKQQVPTPPPQAPQNDNDEDPRKGAMAIDIDGIAFSVSCMEKCTNISSFPAKIRLACMCGISRVMRGCVSTVQAYYAGKSGAIIGMMIHHN